MHHGTYSDQNTRVKGLKVRYLRFCRIGSLAEFTVLEDYDLRYSEPDALMRTTAREIGGHTKHVGQSYTRGQILTLDLHRVTFQPTPPEKTQ